MGNSKDLKSTSQELGEKTSQILYYAGDNELMLEIKEQI